MKDLYLECKEEIARLTQALEDKREQAKEIGLKTKFHVGTTTFHADDISDSQLVYATSLMNSRVMGTTDIVSRPYLHDEMKQERKDFLNSVTHYDSIMEIQRAKSKEETLLFEIGDHLTKEEKRDIFKEENKDRLDRSNEDN